MGRSHRAMGVLTEDFEDFEDMVDDEIEEDICIDEELDEEEDILHVSMGEDDGDAMFDMIVGKLEEILMDDNFNEQTTQFMQQNCAYFDRGDEQKLEYMTIFQRYTDLIEEHIERALVEGVPDFCMEKFLEMLEQRQDEVSEDVTEMLLSLSDFEVFKESVLEHKEQCVEKTSEGILCLQGQPTVIHVDEMEDGEERLDLMDGLSIAPISPKGGLSSDGPPAFGITPT